MDKQQLVYAPVVVTTLCRSAHFIRLIESLKENNWASFTDIFVGVDYPPSDKYRPGWQEILDYLDSGDFSGFASFNVIKRERNYGFEANADDLLSQLNQKYDRFIVLEDDLEVSPNYLEMMDKCLHAFQDDSDVVAVTGYSYPVKWDVSDGATCMKQNFCAAAWGRGYWREKRTMYAEYITSGKMLKDLGNVVCQQSYKKMIDASLREYIPAALCPLKRLHRHMYYPCDISMRAYLAVAGKYVVSPVISTVRNYGFDGSGLYCQNVDGSTDGTTAGTYAYAKQPIDTSRSFNLILNTKDHIVTNHDLLNRFDMRTSSQMRRTRINLWIIQHIGIWAAKAAACLCLPFDVAIRAFQKVARKIAKD